MPEQNPRSESPISSLVDPLEAWKVLFSWTEMSRSRGCAASARKISKCPRSVALTSRMGLTRSPHGQRSMRTICLSAGRYLMAWCSADRIACRSLLAFTSCVYVVCHRPPVLALEARVATSRRTSLSPL